MKLIHEFRQFVQRGNVVDMAVGVIMGASFGKIVNSLVADILMPPIGYLIGGVKFTDLKFTLPEVKIGVIGEELKPATINYGLFLQSTFDFLIIAVCIFMIVKGMNALSRQPPPPPVPPEPTPTEKLLVEIRDLLKNSSPAEKC